MIESKSALSAKEIVQKMMDNDAFSQWLGINILSISIGYAKLGMLVKSEHLNGFGIAHGGISYALADSALAFASNSHGNMAVSVSTSIQHLTKINLGDTLIAETEELHIGNKTANYRITIKNQERVSVASFEGVVYRTLKIWN